MRSGAALRPAVCAIFIALCAWGIASAYLRECSPATVTAELTELRETVTLTGTVMRSECVVCGGAADIKTGRRVLGGQRLAAGLYAPCAGVFSSLVDGYEGLTPTNFDSYSPTVPEGAAGKIVSGGWYFRADSTNCSTSLDSLRRGMRVTLCLPEPCEGEIVENSEKMLLIRCREGLESVINVRKMSIELVLCRASGIKIPAEALHTGTDGAFVRVLRAGQSVKCEVEVIFTGDGWYLVKEDKLRQGMKIIIK